ncbi:DUF2975 domain-containing protein [Algoriphagus sp. A40]|uniref:DUF2975 domain-containing protein n=1 Tax=Algoriphagus sp. A40 TaxID=1945863 RepID=UPI00098482F8|nr:DUF2975 domain-containing protein [Algoriphagus sp. A40]OOG78122.1 hypothetical protein B0E43_03185 [Algoriphagus sp. A40]
MDFSAILNLVIGLLFIYFLVALVCSTVQEIIANGLNLREENLEKWLTDTFRENNLGEKILNHRLVDGLTAAGRKASYIPSRVFSGVLLDLVNDSEKPYTPESLLKALETTELLPADFKRKLAQIISETNGNLEFVKAEIEAWFNDAMLRITGTYKKNTQKIIIAISIGVVLALNIDTIRIIQYLYNHPAESAALADQISENIESLDPNLNPAAFDSLSTEEKINVNLEELKTLKAQLDATQVPIGWQKPDGELSPSEVVNKILGLLFSIVAGIVGAPFWFDILNKVVSLRSSGAKPKDD